jgi:hypothetical protein
MRKLSFDFDTPTTPEQIREAMLDFTERRPRLWDGLSSNYYEVYSVGETTADIREGTGFPAFVWAKEHYDWSQPDTISWNVVESNFCTSASGVSMRISPGASSGSHVTVTWQREPSNFKGKMMIAMVASKDGAMLRKLIKKSVDALPEKLASA